MSHDHYKKDVRHLDMIDVYRVIELFEVTHPALQHALKKILAAGNRGAKGWEKDVQEAIDSLNRALQMRAEDAGVNVGLHVNEAMPKDMQNDPHAELRKTWKPGQRWQGRGMGSSGWGAWVNIIGVEPFWSPNQQYRRHPDDAKEGHD